MAAHESRPRSLTLISRGDAQTANHASVGINRGPMGMELYCRGFFDASRHLLDTCSRNAVPVDTVFYPAVFLFRHGMELAFKVLNAALRRREGVVPKLAGHDLAKLWRAIRQDVIAYVEPSDDPGEDPDATILRVADIDAVVAELSTLDSSGEAFRYDQSRRGETSLPQVDSVDLLQLRDVVAFASEGLLSFIERARAVAEAAEDRRNAAADAAGVERP